MKTEFIQNPDVRPCYRDRTFRMIVSFPVAVYMTVYREEESFFQGIFHLNFWIAVVFSYFVCLLLLWMINLVSGWLDGRLNWRTDTVRRVLAQAWWGYLIPSFVTFVLVTLFFLLVFGIDIRDTEYIGKDFPMARMLIFIGNAYYMAWFLWVVPPAGYVHESAISDWLQRIGERGNGTNGFMEKVLFHARTEEGTVPVPQENIAAIYRQGDHVLLRTFDRQTLCIGQSVREACTQLDAFHFFRLHPRIIVNYRICRNYKPSVNRKLSVTLGPPMNTTEEISRYHVAEFIKWMER